MYQHNIQTSPPYATDDSHQEQFLSEIWKVEPSAIQIIEQNEQCLLFYVLVPLHMKVRSILRRNPVTQGWIDSTRIEHHDWFFWMISTYLPSDQESIGFFLHHIFMPKLSGNRITCMLWSEDQTQSIQLAGFEPLNDAHFRTPGGLQFYLYQLDSRQTGTERTVIEDDFVFPGKDEQAVWLKLTKNILSSYPDLHRQHQLLACCNQLWKTELDCDKAAERIQNVIARQLQWLKEGTKQEQNQARILQYAFLQRRLSHETVALRLDLPMSTYYRQLKKLTQNIAYVLQSQA